MSSAGTVGARREPPEPGLTADEMVARAVSLRPRLVADQAATEERTYYSLQMHEAFLAAGFYHLYVPRRPSTGADAPCRPARPGARG
jgi:hypothetical protein